VVVRITLQRRPLGPWSSWRILLSLLVLVVDVPRLTRQDHLYVTARWGPSYAPQHWEWLPGVCLIVIKGDCWVLAEVCALLSANPPRWKAPKGGGVKVRTLYIANLRETSPQKRSGMARGQKDFFLIFFFFSSKLFGEVPIKGGRMVRVEEAKPLWCTSKLCKIWVRRQSLRSSKTSRRGTNRTPRRPCQLSASDYQQPTRYDLWAILHTSRHAPSCGRAAGWADQAERYALR